MINQKEDLEQIKEAVDEYRELIAKIVLQALQEGQNAVDRILLKEFSKTS